ncbi:Bbp19 family protein [Thalassospira sp. SM2505]
MNTENGWDWFEPQESPNPGAENDHWQACFGSPAGQQVLDDLEAHILHSALGPDVSPGAIWMREGQRALVLLIRRLATANNTAEEADD